MDHATPQPPAELWSNIAGKMDAMQETAAASATTIGYRKYAVAAVLLLISGLSAYFIVNSPLSTTDGSDGSGRSGSPVKEGTLAPSAGKLHQASDANLLADENRNKNSTLVELASPSTTATTRLEKPENGGNHALTAKYPTDAAVTTNTESSSANEATTLLSPRLNSNIAYKNKQSTLTYDTSGLRKRLDTKLEKCFYVGGGLSYNNTWLLNNDTYSGMHDYNVNATKATFNFSANLSLGYLLNGKNAFQLDWFMQNKQTQKYVDYVEGHKQSRENELSYSQLNLSYKRKGLLMKKAEMNLYLNKIVGAYIGKLSSAKTIVDGNEYTVENYYAPWNYGFLAGLEGEAQLRNNLLLTAGVRSTVGLKNIYAGTSNAPSWFDRTYTTALGVYVGVGYVIK